MFSQKYLDSSDIKILDAALVYAGSKDWAVGVSIVKSYQDAEIAQIDIDSLI